MKATAGRSLKYTAAYIGMVLAGLFLCASVYMVYSLCKGMVVGEQIKFIDGFLFLHGILFFTPFVFIATGIFSILYFIRHPDDSKIALILFFIYYPLTWFFGVPFSIEFDAQFNRTGHTFIQTELSPGYFRTSGNTVLYFSSVNEGKAEGVMIKKGTARYINDFPVYKTRDEFSDSIIEHDIKMEDSMKEFLSFYKSFTASAKEEILKGLLSWLCFASIAAVFISISSFRRVSRWRLLNVMNIILLYAAEVIAHTLFYTADFLKPARDLFSEKLFFIPGNSLALCVNLLLCLFIFASGIIITKIKRRRG